jgi:hypothetical protein
MINIMYGLLVVLLVWLPVKTLGRLWPGFMPYRFLVSHPLEMLVFTFGLPLVQSYGELGDAFHVVMYEWIVFVSHWLGVTEYMLPVDDASEEEDGHAAVGVQAAADNGGPAAVGAAAAAPLPPPPAQQQRQPPPAPPQVNDPFDRPPMLRLRLLGLVLLGWATAFVAITYAMSVPVYCGRVVLAASTPGAQVHDFYAFLVGCAAHVIAYEAVSVDFRGVATLVRGALHENGLSVVLRHVAALVRVVVFIAAAVVAFPLAVGLLVDLAVVTPMTCPVKMTPATTLWQDWGLGIMLCKALYELELDGPPPLEWFRGRVRRHAEGFDAAAGTGLDVVTTVALFGPPLALLCLFLAVPYIVGYSDVTRKMWGAAAAVETYRVAFPLALAFLFVRVVRNRLLVYVDRSSLVCLTKPHPFRSKPTLALNYTPRIPASRHQALVDERYLIPVTKPPSPTPFTGTQSHCIRPLSTSAI